MIINRRSFVLLATTTLAVRPALAAETADIIYSGGPILTMNDADPRVDAVAVKGGRIIAAGSETDVMALKGPNSKIIDLGGRAMLPGFVDAHGHVMIGGVQAMGANMLPAPDGPCNDIAAIQRTLRDWMEANKDEVIKINLIFGFGYDNAQLTELRHPTRDDLDQVSTEIPILIIHQSSHLAAINSKALEIVGYTAATPNPAGGVIQRKPGSQEPNGVLEETAFFGAAMALLGNIGPDGMKAFIRAGADLWARYGYTTAQEGRSIPATAALIREVADEGGLKIDVQTYTDVLVDRDWIKANTSSSYKNHFRVAGAKLTIDGSPQGFTAWRDRPYYNPVGDYPPGYLGYPAATSEAVIDAVDWAFANNIQIITHANGEAAGDLLIASVRAASNKHGSADRRAVLIHGQFEREDQVNSYRSLGIFPALFPMHTYYWGDWHRDHTVGPVNADNISPTGWYMQRGMIFSSHHDAPVAFPNSMRVLDATVTRRSRSNDIIGPAHRVPVLTALKAMTIWPAYSQFEEATKGSIEVGKLADFVILSADPTAVDPETLDTIKVTETIKEGETVFSLVSDPLKKTEVQTPSLRQQEAFSGFLRALAVDREFNLLPKKRQTRMNRAVLANAMHNSACLGPVMAELTVAMMSGR